MATLPRSDNWDRTLGDSSKTAVVVVVVVVVAVVIIELYNASKF